ncbi:helix-turn-helix domain-containing protein [Actinocatenispora comari]|uniref:Transcriptional regulator n=1 Tax=Actinocatenispora comari TaxID=2807577 RepID=A0A8J4A6G4_9ACTN|nr:helix-turn-helix domain-containing protein [Actinocatenispora comari]GIL25756.1 transcriptional regulator [Actinocatenispora comari]
MDELPIGRRVAYWRARRRMSQQLFADQIGKSKSWVDKVERGVRRLDKFSVLYEIADVLKVDPQVLFGGESHRQPDSVNCVDQVEVEEIRAALENYDQVVAFFEPPLVEQVSLDELRKAISHAWASFQHAKYGMVARSLPKLLRDAQSADAAHDDSAMTATENGTRINAAHLLAQTYQIAASVLRKLGEHELGWLAADRAIGVSHRAGDPLLAGVATFRVANAMLALGRARPALDLNVQVAHRLAPASGAEVTPQRLSVYGMLLLQGAMAAARVGDLATSRDLLRAADEAAERLGRDANHYWTVFGPTNVALHRAAAAVDLGEHGIAISTHESLELEAFGAMLPERRAHHLVDVCRAYTQIGDLDKAAELLVEADRLAPSEIRCRPHAHEVLTGVLRRSHGTPAAPLAELADHLGVAV